MFKRNTFENKDMLVIFHQVPVHDPSNLSWRKCQKGAASYQIQKNKWQVSAFVQAGFFKFLPCLGITWLKKQMTAVAWITSKLGINLRNMISPIFLKHPRKTRPRRWVLGSEQLYTCLSTANPGPSLQDLSQGIQQGLPPNNSQVARCNTKSCCITKCPRKTHASVGFDRSRSKGFTALDFAKRFSDAKVKATFLAQLILTLWIQANFDPNLITPSEYVEILSKVDWSSYAQCLKPDISRWIPTPQHTLATSALLIKGCPISNLAASWPLQRMFSRSAYHLVWKCWNMSNSGEWGDRWGWVCKVLLSSLGDWTSCWEGLCSQGCNYIANMILSIHQPKYGVASWQ